MRRTIRKTRSRYFASSGESFSVSSLSEFFTSVAIVFCKSRVAPSTTRANARCFFRARRAKPDQRKGAATAGWLLPSEEIHIDVAREARPEHRIREYREAERCLARGNTDIARSWVYVRDDRPFGGPAPPAAVFYYSRDRGGAHPQAHLADYAGILQADAYGGYGKLYEADRRPGPITQAACWSHARRKFFVLADLAAVARQH